MLSTGPRGLALAAQLASPAAKGAVTAAAAAGAAFAFSGRGFLVADALKVHAVELKPMSSVFAVRSLLRTAARW